MRKGKTSTFDYIQKFQISSRHVLRISVEILNRFRFPMIIGIMFSSFSNSNIESRCRIHIVENVYRAPFGKPPFIIMIVEPRGRFQPINRKVDIKLKYCLAA